MRTKYFLIIVLGTIACMLVMDGSVLQPLMNHDSNLVYAMGPKLPGPHRPPHRPPPGPTNPVTEPSTLFLLGAGVAGIGTYLYYKHGKNKK